MEEIIGWIYEGKLDKLLQNIKKMNRKAIKLECEQIELTVTNEEVYRPINPEDIHGPKARFVKVILLGESPKLSDWQFVSCCDHDPVLGQTMRSAPGKETPVQYQSNDSYCEHCNSKRARNTTYIVENVKTGEFKRVGSTCVKDFLGHKAAEMFLFYASYISMVTELDEEYGYEGGSDRSTLYYNLEQVLAITVKCVGKWGYTSKKKVMETGEGCPTSDDVIDQLHPPKGFEGEVYKITEEDLEATRPMIEWVKTLPDTSDYNLNLIRIATAGATKMQLMGYTVSIVPQYRKAMDLIEARAKAKPSEWIGEEGEKLTLQLRWTQSHGSDGGRFGYSYFHKFVDVNGNLFSWSTKTEIDTTQSCWFTVKGTVKGHSNYNGYKTTDILRCKLEVSLVPFWTIENKEKKY
jgi:hypothetical protein